MAKKLSEAESAADPVRARLQSSRMAALASRAAAPSPNPVTEEGVAESNSGGGGTTQPKASPNPRRAATAPVPERTRKAPPLDLVPDLKPEPAQEATTTVRKARFTPTEAQANQEMVALIGHLTHSKASESGITRVLWSLLRDAEAGLKQQGRRGVALRRPPNGSTIEMAQYERDLARFMLNALKSLEM